MKVTIYSYHEQWSWEVGGKVVCFTSDRENQADSSRVLHKLGEVEVDIPDHTLLTQDEVRNLLIGGIRQQVKDIQVAAHVETQKLNDKIQELLCLPNAGEL